MRDTRLNVMPFGAQLIFRCPRDPSRECAANLKGMAGDGPTWENIGSDEQPTLVPSFNCVHGCGWHGYIVKGETSDAPPGMSAIVGCAACHEPHLIRIANRIDARGALAVELDFQPFAASSPAEEGTSHG